MTHTAIGIFQADADWNISVRVAGFASTEAAKCYANGFRIRLMNGRLYRDHADGQSPEDIPWIEVTDADVSLSRLSLDARNRIAKAHQDYQARGLDNVAIALKSIKDFEAYGSNPLVTSEDDYDPVNLPIAQWQAEEGLTCGFGSLAYAVEPDNAYAPQGRGR